MTSWPPEGLDTELERMKSKYFSSLKETDLKGLLKDPVLKNVAAVSSFGAERSGLLHWVVGGQKESPIFFKDAGEQLSEIEAVG